MNSDKLSPKFTMHPPWILIGVFFALALFSLTMAICGFKPMYRPYIPYDAAAIFFTCMGLVYWKRTDFYETGFTHSRCVIFRRTVTWDQVFQITVTPYDRKGFVRNVMLIVLNSAPSCYIFRHGDNVSDFVSASQGHVFVCEWSNMDYKSQDKLREFIEIHWGKKIT